MFNKRHYEAIATVLQECKRDMLNDEDHGDCGSVTEHTIDCVAFALADLFKSDNSRFDRDRFTHACLPGSNVRAKTAHLKAS